MVFGVLVGVLVVEVVAVSAAREVVQETVADTAVEIVEVHLDCCFGSALPLHSVSVHLFSGILQIAVVIGDCDGEHYMDLYQKLEVVGPGCHQNLSNLETTFVPTEHD